MTSESSEGNLSEGRGEECGLVNLWWKRRGQNRRWIDSTDVRNKAFLLLTRNIKLSKPEFRVETVNNPDTGTCPMKKKGVEILLWLSKIRHPCSMLNYMVYIESNQ